MSADPDEATAPTIIERTPAGGLVVLHTAADETPAQTAALLVATAFGGFAAIVANEIREGTFEPRTAQATVFLLREAFARIEPSLRDRLVTNEIDAACLEVTKNQRTA